MYCYQFVSRVIGFMFYLFFFSQANRCMTYTKDPGNETVRSWQKSPPVKFRLVGPHWVENDLCKVEEHKKGNKPKSRKEQSRAATEYESEKCRLKFSRHLFI